MLVKTIISAVSLALGVVLERTTLRPNTAYRNIKNLFEQRVKRFNELDSLKPEEVGYVNILYSSILKKAFNDKNHYEEVISLDSRLSAKGI